MDTVARWSPVPIPDRVHELVLPLPKVVKAARNPIVSVVESQPAMGAHVYAGVRVWSLWTSKEVEEVVGLKRVWNRMRWMSFLVVLVELRNRRETLTIDAGGYGRCWT
jgi:hypothetical protein